MSGLLDASGGNVAITGDPGAGKSVVLYRFAMHRPADVVYLTPDQLRGTAGDTRAELNLNHDLHEVLTGWTGSRPGLLLLDGIDQTRGVDASTWLPGLAQRLRGTRWRIVASIRSFDLRHGFRWQSMFSGTPVDAAHADSELSRVAHLVVNDLTAEEIETVFAASPSMQEVFDQASDDLAGLLANPFNLNLVGDLISADANISHVRSRLDLLTRFWRLRVVDAPDGRVRQRVVQSLIASMVEVRSQQASDAHLDDSAMLNVLEDLLRDGVLRESPANQWAPSRPVGFAHPVLFDYAAAINALGDVTVSDSVVDVLDADPDLSMVLRPSLDYRVAIAWHNDLSRASYWRLALRLAAQRSGHMLAAAAAAATVAAHELRDAAELEVLESACVAAAAAAPWTVDDARGLVFLIAAGLDAPGRSPAALDAFGQLLEGLAERALSDDDIGLALLVAQLCRRAAADHPPTPGSKAAHHWTRAALGAVLVGRRDLNDPRRVNLADHGGRALAIAATLDAAATADTIRLVIAEPALRGWGVRAVRPLIDALPHIAAQDPAIAVELAASVWLFQDDPSQPTNMLNSQIFPLISNRQQDLESAQYQVAQAFPALAVVDVVAATRLLLKIVEQDSQSGHHRIESQTRQRALDALQRRASVRRRSSLASRDDRGTHRPPPRDRTGVLRSDRSAHRGAHPCRGMEPAAPPSCNKQVAGSRERPPAGAVKPVALRPQPNLGRRRAPRRPPVPGAVRTRAPRAGANHPGGHRARRRRPGTTAEPPPRTARHPAERRHGRPDRRGRHSHRAARPASRRPGAPRPARHGHDRAAFRSAAPP